MWIQLAVSICQLSSLTTVQWTYLRNLYKNLHKQAHKQMILNDRIEHRNIVETFSKPGLSQISLKL